jgi:glycine cleavage system H protein
MSIPANLRYTTDHEWARDEGDGSYTVGITAFAQDSLGGIVYVELPAAGSRVQAGGRFGTVESTKSVSELYAPITGTVVASNSGLEAAPETVNTDPYGGGWMVRIQADASGEYEALMDASAYTAHTAG